MNMFLLNYYLELCCVKIILKCISLDTHEPRNPYPCALSREPERGRRRGEGVDGEREGSQQRGGWCTNQNPSTDQNLRPWNPSQRERESKWAGVESHERRWRQQRRYYRWVMLWWQMGTCGARMDREKIKHQTEGHRWLTWSNCRQEQLATTAERWRRGRNSWVGVAVVTTKEKETRTADIMRGQLVNSQVPRLGVQSWVP